jgi:hypothetical protein
MSIPMLGHCATLKRLAILAVVTVVFPIYGQEKAAHPEGDKQNSQGFQKMQPDAPPSDSSVTIAQIRQEQPTNEANSPNQTSEGFIARHIPSEKVTTLGLLIVGLAGIFVAVCTLIKLERQTKATEVAAEAALHQANYLVASERPWIAVNILPDEETAGKFILWANIKGRTPAWIVSGSATHKFRSNPDDLKVPPGYSECPIRIPLETPFLEGERFEIYPDGINIDAVLKNQKLTRDGYKDGFGEFLCFYGRIVYRDAFTDPKNPVYHETRWCFLYRIDKDGTEIFSPAGPWEYRTHS